MEQYTSKFLNELEGGRVDFTDEDFTRIKQFVEWTDRATAPVAAAPTENAPALSTSIGISCPRPSRSCEVVRVYGLS